MGGSEQVGEVVTLSGSGVTLRKEFVREEYTVPTIRFVVDNESDEDRTVEITEAVPEGHSVDAVGFHPEYGAEHWTCYEDERAEFVRDVPRNTTYETVYGVRIEDPSAAEAFMTEPRLIVDGESIGDADTADHGGSETEVEKDLLDDAERASTNGTGDDDSSGDGRTAGNAATNGIAATTNGAAATAVPGPETGSVIERLVEELRRNDVDAEQKEVLREQLDLGVPSETKARIEQLGTRVETIAAYADALEEFLDEEGTAQEVISDFETRVEALREDVATIREETASNAGEIADVDGDLGTLESQVDDLEGTVSTVADQADDVEDSLATTDSRLETVEAGLRGAEDGIDANAADVDELDRNLTDLEENLTDVEDDFANVEERVSETESHVATLDEAAAGLRTDLDDVEGDVDAVTATTADTEAEVEGLESDLEGLEADLDDQGADLDEIRDEVEDLRDWRAQLGEMFE